MYHTFYIVTIWGDISFSPVIAYILTTGSGDAVREGYGYTS